MDERLSTALAFSNYRVTLNNQLQLERAKAKDLLCIAYNGGFFDIDFSLMSYVQLKVSAGDKDAVLIDRNDKPIKITDLEKFSKDMQRTYTEVANSYYVNYTKLSKSRNVKSLVNVKD